MDDEVCRMHREAVDEIKVMIKEFAEDNKKHWEKYDKVLFGNGEIGINTRIDRLEISHKNTQKGMWFMISSVTAVVCNALWEMFKR